MYIEIKNPTLATAYHITKEDWAKINKYMVYEDASIRSLLNNHFRNQSWKRTNFNTWEKRRSELEKQAIKYLYTLIDTSTIKFRPAMIPLLSIDSSDVRSNAIVYPSLNNDIYQWHHQFPYKLRQYQEISINQLLMNKHAHVELTTGSGKAAIALHLAKQCGLRCAVIVPSRENFEALYKDFSHYLGAGIIGTYGNGKKVTGKNITICIGKSLSLIEKNSEDWKFFRHIQTVIVDESHSFASQTMSALFHELFAHVPYRFFLSATQVHGKDNDNVLYNIIGKCVYTLQADEAIRSGYICKHRFEIYKNIPVAVTKQEKENINIAKQNPLTMRRNAFLHNSTISDIIANRCLADSKVFQSSLILVDEIGQIALLLKSFRTIDPDFDINTIAMAHGETNKTRLKDLCIPSNNTKGVNDAIQAFNKCEKLILIGTATIHTGTNLFPCFTSYNFIGGGASNKIKTCQAVIGRAVRFAESNPFFQQIPDHVPKKTEAVIVDFDIDERQMKKHLNKRLEYYGYSKTRIDYI